MSFLGGLCEDARRVDPCFVGVQEEIIREAQTMRQQASQYVLPLHCSFVHQQNLWMVMPYVAGGSVLNIMKYAFAEVCCAQTIACPSRQHLTCSHGHQVLSSAYRLCVSQHA